jgi:4'-phosphopantetheinyl transferase superfamily
MNTVLDAIIVLGYAQGMIVAIGVDIIELDRIRGVWSREGDKFLHRIFTAPERAYCLDKADPLPHLAARFAAKEARRGRLGPPSAVAFRASNSGRDAGRRMACAFVVVAHARARGGHGDPRGYTLENTVPDGVF